MNPVLHLSAADWWDMFQHFASLSLLAVGGAITTAPDIHRYLVDETHWLSDAQFTASIALAQGAPGPNVMFVALMGKDTLDPAVAPDVYVVVRDLDLRYLAPIRPECEVKLVLGVRQVRAAGLTIDFEFRSADLSVLHARGTRTVCRMDGATHQPAAWSDEFRAKHEALVR